MNSKFKQIGSFRTFKFLIPVAMAVAGFVAPQPAQAQTGLTPGLWLRADTGVETSGGKVTTWKDQSGNSRNATQATGADSPTQVTSALNGQSVIRFDGNDGLTLGNISAAFPSAASLFIVATINDGSYNLFTTVTGADAHGGGDTWWRLPIGGTTAAYMAVFRNGRTYEVLAGKVPSSGSHLFAVESSSSKWEMLIDGSGGGPNNSGSHRAGDEYRIGMPDTSNGVDQGKWLTGDIAEIIIFKTALTETERNQVGSYLSKRYGLSSTYTGSGEITFTSMMGGTTTTTTVAPTGGTTTTAATGGTTTTTTVATTGGTTTTTTVATTDGTTTTAETDGSTTASAAAGTGTLPKNGISGGGGGCFLRD